MEDAVRLCRCAAHNDVTTAIATPHLAHPDSVDDFCRLRDRLLDELRAEIDKKGIELELLAGAEVFVNDDLFYAPNLDKVTLNGSRYLLIEFDFRGLTANRLVKYVEEVRSRGHVPIIAHPERYYFTQDNYDIVNHLASIGTLFQINADDLAGAGGSEEGELAALMAANGLAQFIASDAHSVRHRANNLLEMSRYFPLSIPSQIYEELLDTNPNAVINDEDIVLKGFMPIRKRRLF